MIIQNLMTWDIIPSPFTVKVFYIIELGWSLLGQVGSHAVYTDSPSLLGSSTSNSSCSPSKVTSSVVGVECSTVEPPGKCILCHAQNSTSQDLIIPMLSHGAVFSGNETRLLEVCLNSKPDSNHRNWEAWHCTRYNLQVNISLSITSYSHQCISANYPQKLVSILLNSLSCMAERAGTEGSMHSLNFRRWKLNCLADGAEIFVHRSC